MYYKFNCPACGEELSAEVFVSDHMVEWGEECDNEECGYKFSQSEVLDIYDKALEDATSSLIDNAEYRFGDR